jgi:hypothetical protein
MHVSGELSEEDAADYLAKNGNAIKRIRFAPDIINSGWVKCVMSNVQQFCPHITSFASSRGFGLASFQAMNQAWPLLQEISLAAGSQGDYLLTVAQHCPNLSSVTVLGSCPKMSGLIWIRFFETMGTRLLNLRTHTHISKNALLAMAQHCTQLRSMSDEVGCLRDIPLTQIAEGCSLLEALELPMIGSCPSAGILAVAHNGRLQKLRARWVTTEVLQVCAQLRVLHMGSDYIDLRSILLALAAHCHLLVEIVVSPTSTWYSAYHYDFPSQLAENFPLLEVLQLNLYVGAGTITALGTHCHNLRRLIAPVRKGDLSDAAITALAQGCTKLRELSFILTPPVTMEGITALAAHCRSLRKVHVDQKILGTTHRYGQRVLSGRKLVVVKGMFC